MLAISIIYMSAIVLTLAFIFDRVIFPWLSQSSVKHGIIKDKDASELHRTIDIVRFGLGNLNPDIWAYTIVFSPISTLLITLLISFMSLAVIRSTIRSRFQ